MTTTKPSGEIRQKSINYFFAGKIENHRINQLSRNFRTRAEAQAFAEQRGGLEIYEAIFRYSFDFEVEEFFNAPRFLTLDHLKARDERRKAALLAEGVK